MDFTLNPSNNSPSPSSSASSASSSTPHRFPATTSATSASGATDRDPMHSWWESVSKQRSRILALSSLLAGADSGDADCIASFADSDRPALSLLSSSAAYSAVFSALADPSSGSGSDPLCQWLYDTYLSSDPQLRLVVLSFLPHLSGVYLSRVHSADSSSLPSLAGFEAVLLAIYAAEVKSRAGKPMLVHIPDLSQPSLYHTPRSERPRDGATPASVGVLSPPLEPQNAVKSTKRACIIGVVLQCYFKQISQMPAWSKLELCRIAAAWAGQDCACNDQIDGEEEGIKTIGFVDSGLSNGNNGGADISEDMSVLTIKENGDSPSSEPKGVRIPLPWELVQPILRILGHCLLGPLNSQDVKGAASVAVRRLYARASHDLCPQVILATRSLINLDKNARNAARAAAVAVAANSSSNADTTNKAKRPEILLVSK